MFNFNNLSYLSDIYPIEAYDSDNGVFFIADERRAALGFGFISDPLSYLDKSIAQRLSVLLNHEFPKRSMLQISLICSPDIKTNLIPQELDLLSSRNDALLQEMVKQRISFLRQGALETIPYIKNLLRDFKLCISVSVPITDSTPSESDLMRVGQVKQSVSEILDNIGIHSISLTPQSFLALMTPFFNNSPLSDWHHTRPTYDETRSIVEQLLDYDKEIIVEKDGLVVGDYYVNTLSVKRYPEHIFLGDAIKYAGDLVSGSRGIHTPFIITGTMFYEDCTSLKHTFNTRRQWITNQAYGPMLKFMPKLATKLHDFELLSQEIQKGDRLLKFNLSIVTFANSREHASETCAAIRTYYKENGFDVIPDSSFCLPIFINALPLGCDPEVASFMTRFRLLSAKFVTPLLPILSTSKGTKSSGLTLISRNGQLMNYSLFDSSTNFNLCIAAQSGSGKSFVVNELILSYLAKGAQIFVIDVGRSYQKLTSFLNGSFLCFDGKTDIDLNPFSHISNFNDDADMLVDILAVMISEKDRLSSFQLAELKRITGLLFMKHGQSMTIDLLADELLGMEDSRISDMGKQLHAFTSSGTYGSFFSRVAENSSNSAKENIKNLDALYSQNSSIDNVADNGNTSAIDDTKDTNPLNNRLVVLELEELKGRRHLQQVVLLELISRIQHQMFLGDRSVPKLLILDEAWAILKDENISTFIENGYRRFRKYGAAAITVTQSINDLYSSPSGIAIAENSSSFFLLGQKPETVDTLKKSNRLSLTDGEYELLKTVHTVPGGYSEIFIIGEYLHAIGRLVVDDYRKLLYSTKAEDVSQIDNVIKEGYTVAEAISIVFERRRGL